ncbi:hypothetical protein CDL12_04211 [Handroanthus impetiginosus]|uniref:Uncharacterized protein n=1 Tax=Handroanthus impetiginosus TaxID=429701 RepID=A0A2G9HZZ2_9LAMI|nr:hypothetical protein CDL12_04211 [Handroanthus impetiginosus]
MIAESLQASSALLPRNAFFSAAVASSGTAPLIRRVAQITLILSYITLTFSLIALISLAMRMSSMERPKALWTKFRALLSASRFRNTSIVFSASGTRAPSLWRTFAQSLRNALKRRISSSSISA